MGGKPSEVSAELYDAVGQIWLQLFGEHVHVGYYATDDDKHARSWQQAQLDHIDAVLQLAGVSKAQKLLDLGCGYGGTAVYVAQKLRCQALGVNISPFQVQVANQLAVRSGFEPDHARFVVGDALQPDLPDASFDLVVSIESAAYMPDKQKFVSQLARLCAPSGTVILVDFCRASGTISDSLKKRLTAMDNIFATPGSWHSAEEYKQLMGASGLTVTQDGNWTRNVCGFWNVGLLTLLLRQTHQKEGLLQWFITCLIRTLYVVWFFVTGGQSVLNMTKGYLLGEQKRVVQGGLDSGVLEYHVIVAKKPAVGATAALDS